MTKLLDLLEYYLGERGHNPCRIDGAVAQSVRQEQVCCNQSNSDAFFCQTFKDSGHVCKGYVTICMNSR